MAAPVFQNNQEINRQDIQAAIAKAVELRALHAALIQGNSPANLRLQTCPSPSGSRSSNQFSAQDYPVFTPSYEDETLPGYHQILSNNQRLSQNLDFVNPEQSEVDEPELSDANRETQAPRTAFLNREHHVCSFDDRKLNSISSVSQITVLQSSPGTEILKSSRRTGSVDFKTPMTCNRCKPAVINRDNENNNKNKNTVVPINESQTPSKNKGQILSWLFPRLKKKLKTDTLTTSPDKFEPEEVSQVLKDWQTLSLESLKKELTEANENKDTALMEVVEMKSSLGELKQKLGRLEHYCEDLKKALKQTQALERTLTKRAKSIEINKDNLMPVTHEVMVEGFLQIVSETRLSVNQFCKSLVTQIEETSDNSMEKLKLLLEPYNLTLNSKSSKVVLYHLEALINQSLYQDFENCIFQKNGSPTMLDPQQDRHAKFASFVSLRNLSWNEVLRKGTKYYSEEFSRFCDQKMSCIVSMLNWLRPWPEQLLQSFFITAKCLWLLHLLAFSFSPPLSILRVQENRPFDPLYMEDIVLDRHRSQTPLRVQIMVMPGFYVQDRVLRCKVLCKCRIVT